jgi:hypothetical protein
VANRNTIELRLEVKDDGSVVIKKFTGQGTKDLQKLEKSSASMTKKMGGGLQQLRRHWLAFAAAMAGALYIVKRTAESFLDVGKQLERFRTQLTAVLGGNRRLAEETLKWVREFAAYTPFMTDEVVRAFVMLKSVGIPATREMMTTLGDVAYVFGRNIEDVSTALVSFETEVLRRLGIEIDRTGKQAIIASGNVRVAVNNDAASIRQALLDVWAKRFPGAMKEAEKDWQGMTALLASEWWEFRAAVMEARVFDYLKEGLRTLLDYINKLKAEGKLAEYAEETGERIISVLKAIAYSGAAVSDSLRGLEMIIQGLAGAYYMLKSTSNIPEMQDSAIKKLEKIRDRIEELAFGKSAITSTRDFFAEIDRRMAELKTAEAAPAAPTTPAGPMIDPKAQAAAEKALKAYESLYGKNANRIKELTLEERDYKLWALEQWYQESVAIYEAAGKETVTLTQLYALERAEIERQYQEEQTAKRQELVDQWEEMEREITHELMAESERRKAIIEEEYMARLLQLDLFLEKGIITEEAYTQAIIMAAEARKNKLAELKEAEKGYLVYLEEMNKQTALNIQQSWSSLLSGLAKGEFESFGDWFDSFLDSLYDTWADTLAKMAYEWVNNFIAKLDTSGAGATGGGGGFNWGGLLTGLLSGLVGALRYGGVMRNGRILPFGSGGIVTQPTIFPMADGNVGLMGERDWEAVMPLARTPKGELGVKTTGEGSRQSVYNAPLVQFNITTPDADSFRRSQGQILADASMAVQRGMRNR